MNIFKSPVWLLLSVALILSLSVSATAGDGRDETLNLSMDGITVLAVDAGGGKLIIEGLGRSPWKPVSIRLMKIQTGWC
jgi:hypothetical protein